MSRAVSPDRKSAGFVAGVGSLFSATRFVVGTPATWPFALVPGLVLAVLGAGFVWLSVAWVRPAVAGSMPDATSWYGQLGIQLVAWSSAVVSGVLGLLVAIVLTPPLSGPALERLVTLQESGLGVPARRHVSWLAEIWCGARAQLAAALVAWPLLGLLGIIGFAVPPAAAITTPLAYLVGALSLAWNLFDYPLTLRGVRLRDRLALARRHPGATIGFGGAFATLFVVPCLNILLLPIAVVAATRLVWRLLDEDPALAPALERAPLSSGPPRSPAAGEAASSDH